eukprot:Skav208567  [mRNA]  locus=scaffold177:91886:109950:+ [translate_table: standard]
MSRSASVTNRPSSSLDVDSQSFVSAELDRDLRLIYLSIDRHGVTDLKAQCLGFQLGGWAIDLHRTLDNFLHMDSSLGLATGTLIHPWLRRYPDPIGRYLRKGRGLGPGKRVKKTTAPQLRPEKVAAEGGFASSAVEGSPKLFCPGRRGERLGHRWRPDPSLSPSPPLLWTSVEQRAHRRARANARRLLWLHRRGHLRLTSSALKKALSVLAQHHSKDPSFLNIIRKMTDPWKCRSCGKMHAASAEFCPKKGHHWERCYDPEYVHIPQPAREVRQDWSENWNQPWRQEYQKPKKPKKPWNNASPSPRNRQHWDAQQPKSPREKEDKRGKGKGKGKGKTKLPPEPTWEWQPPDGKGKASSSTAPPPPAPSPAEGQLKQLLSMLQKEENLSPDVQNLMHSTITATSRDDTKMMHAAVTRLGIARKHVQETQAARLGLHQTWRSFIEDGISRWQKYVQDFDHQEQELLQSLTKAREELREAQEHLEATKEKVHSDGPSMEVEDDIGDEYFANDSGTILQAHTKMMVETLSQMKQKVDESFQLEERKAKQAKLDNLQEIPKAGTLGVPGGSAMAREIAVDLAMQNCESWNAREHQAPMKCANRARKAQRVRFHSQLELYQGLESSVIMHRTTLPLDALAHWPDKPWRTLPLADCLDVAPILDVGSNDSHCKNTGMGSSTAKDSENCCFDVAPNLEVGTKHSHRDAASLGAKHVEVVMNRYTDVAPILVAGSSDSPRDAAFLGSNQPTCHSHESDHDEHCLLAHVARPPVPFPALPPQELQGTQVEHNEQEEHNIDGEVEDAWQSAHIFQLGSSVEETRVRWNSYEDLHADVSAILGIPPRELLNIFEVESPPHDLGQAGIAALLLRRTGDLRVGDAHQMTLVDLQIHEHWPNLQYQVTRLLRVLPPQLMRSTLLEFLGVGAYCRSIRNRCLVWLNNRLVSMQLRTPMLLQHGDYLKVAIPPRPDFCDLPTRNVVLYTNDGLPPRRFRAEYARNPYNPRRDRFPSSLQRLDTALPEHDEAGFLHMASESLKPLVWHIGVQTDHLEEGDKMIGGESIRHCRLDPLEIDPNQEIQAFLPDEHASEEEDASPEDDVAPVATIEAPSLTFAVWFIRGVVHPKCLIPKHVRPRSLDNVHIELAIRAAWDAWIDPSRPLQIHAVRPSPITMDGIEPVPHLIAMQDVPIETRGILVSALSSDVLWRRVAGFGPAHITRYDLIVLVDQETTCYTNHLQFQCRVTTGQNQIGSETFYWCDHGLSFDIHMDRQHFNEDTTPPITDIAGVFWDDDDEQPMRYILSSSQRLHFPDRPVFPVHTWYIDHQGPLHCHDSRLAALSTEEHTWTQTLKQIWADRLRPGIPVKAHRVAPHPSYHPQGWDHYNVVASVVVPAMTEQLIWHADGFTFCGPGHRDWQCVLKRNSLVLAPGEQTYVQNGECLQLIADQRLPSDDEVEESDVDMLERRRDQGTQTDELDALDQVGLLQIPLQRSPERLIEDTVAQVPQPGEIIPLCLDDLLPINPGRQTCAVELRNPDMLECFPSVIELSLPLTSLGIEQELQHWGHDCFVHQPEGLHQFFCFDRKTLDKCVYLYHCRGDDGAVQSTVMHRTPHKISLIDHMKFLHQLEYYRAVVMDMQQLTEHPICDVFFVNNRPELQEAACLVKQCTPWPDRQQQRQDEPFFHFEHPVQISSSHEHTPGGMTIATDLTDAHWISLFEAGQFVLCTQFDLPDLPAVTSRALSMCTTREALERIDRFVIYTDGSSQPSRRREAPLYAEAHGYNDTWAFIVLAEEYHADGTSDLAPIGWLAQPILYDPNANHHIGSLRIGSEFAEGEGLFWAAWWRFSQNTRTPTIFRSDSINSCKTAMGQMGFSDQETVLLHLRYVFQALRVLLPDDSLRVEHVAGHAGDPWNEFVDHVAKQELAKSYCLARICVDMSTWKSILPHLWFLLHHHESAGTKPVGALYLPRPEIPTAHRPQTTTQKPTTPAKPIEHRFLASFATGNVQSLFNGPEGHAGKLAYLKEQMRAHHLCFLGLQETRGYPGTFEAQGFLRLCTSALKGTEGVELWVDLEQPFGYANRRPLHFRKHDFTVTHASPTMLVVHVVHHPFDFWVITAHAPHSGHVDDVRTDWWTDLSRHMMNISAHADVFVLLDANATSGQTDHMHVFQHGDVDAVTTPDFRQWMDHHELCLPTTGPAHHGTHDTWTSPDRRTSKRIDYVVTRCRQFPHCVHSQVLEDFDLGNMQEDHAVVAAQFDFRHDRLPGPSTSHRRTYNRHAIKDADLHWHLQLPHSIQTEVDVETSVRSVTQQLHSALQATCPRPRQGPKKPQVTAEIWTLRRRKLQAKRRLKLCHPTRDREHLWQVFRAWLSTKRSLDQPVEPIPTSYVRALRTLFDTTVCPACLKDYHTFTKIKAHLRYHDPCRQILAARPRVPEPAPGQGSRANAALDARYDRLLPVHQAEGPLAEPAQRGTLPEIHFDLQDRVITYILEHAYTDDAVTHLQQLIRECAVSWSQCCMTLQYIAEHFTEEEADISTWTLEDVQRCMGELCNPVLWPFLGQTSSRESQTMAAFTLQDYEEWCIALYDHAKLAWVPHHPIPRVFGRRRVLLHAFSGRRRPGDLQWFLEHLETTYAKTHDFQLDVVSLDIVIHATMGDVACDSTRDFWLYHIRARHVVAFLGGPPCNTWSVARENALPDRRGPRVVRRDHAPWGLPSLYNSELEAVCEGNELMGFALESMAALAPTGGVGFLEHPAQPEDPQAATIWAQPILRLLADLPGMRIARVLQGLHGATSSKPTDLLVLNVPMLEQCLQKWQLTTRPPGHVSIGQDEAGRFRTAPLKEYPPSFCGSLAQALLHAIDMCPVEESIQAPHAFLATCADMNVRQKVGGTVMPKSLVTGSILEPLSYVNPSSVVEVPDKKDDANAEKKHLLEARRRACLSIKHHLMQSTLSSVSILVMETGAAGKLAPKEFAECRNS